MIIVFVAMYFVSALQRQNNKSQQVKITCQEYFMPGGWCFSDVFQPLPGSLEPRLRLVGRVVTVLRLMLEGDLLLLSAVLLFGG